MENSRGLRIGVDFHAGTIGKRQPEGKAFDLAIEAAAKKEEIAAMDNQAETRHAA